MKLCCAALFLLRFQWYPAHGLGCTVFSTNSAKKLGTFQTGSWFLYIMSSSNDSQVVKLLTGLGYSNLIRVTSTLQGSIWRARRQILHANNSSIFSKRVIKITKDHNNPIINDKHHKIHEDTLNEISILKYLTQNSTAPTSIIKYIDCFRRYIFWSLNRTSYLNMSISYINNII